MVKKLIIADGHRVVAEGIAQLICGRIDAKIAGIASTLAEAKALVAETRNSMLLLEMAMPDGNGILAIPELLKIDKNLKIAIFTSCAEPTMIRWAMESGASGYLLKSMNADEFIEGLSAMMQATEGFYCQESKKKLGKNKEDFPQLTAREREILKLIVEGLTMKEISERLFLSFETIHGYTKTLRQKLGCKNSTSLVRIAINTHLVW